jgi:hypothetical protein
MNLNKPKSDIEDLLEGQTWKTRKYSLSSKINLFKIRKTKLSHCSSSKFEKNKLKQPPPPVEMLLNEESPDDRKAKNDLRSSKSLFQVPLTPGSEKVKLLTQIFQVPAFPMSDFGNKKNMQNMDPKFKLLPAQAGFEELKEVKKSAGRVKKNSKFSSKRFLFLNDFLKIKENGYLRRYTMCS